MLIVKSSLGETDCCGCHIFKKGKVLFAKLLQPDYLPEFVTLPIKIAEMPNAEAAELALRIVQYAIKTGKDYVDLTDLE